MAASTWTGEIPTDSPLETGNLPALTTVYVPPSECSNQYVLLPPTPVSGDTSGSTSYFSRLANPEQPWPSGSPESFSSETIAMSVAGITLGPTEDAKDAYISCQPFGRRPTYSPGICPQGQTIADMIVWQPHDQPQGTDRNNGVLWEASCCNSGMTIPSSGRASCGSRITTAFPVTSLWVTTMETGFMGVSDGHTTDIAETNSWTWFNDTPSTISSGTATADPVVIFWRYSDLASFPPDYATSLAKRIGVDLSTPTSTPATTPRPPPSQKPSSGAIAGIAVGGTAFLVLIGGFIFYLLTRRRAKQRKREALALDGGVPELENEEEHPSWRKWFLGGRWRSEAEAETKPQELTAERGAQELVADERAQELDSQGLMVVPGSPVELDAAQEQNFRHGDEK